MRLLKQLSLFQLFIVFFVLFIIAISGSLRKMELRAEEPRRAISTMEMCLTNEWIVPKIHGAYYYNKPPLFNWVMAGVFQLSGSFSEPWVRLPSLLALVLTSFFVYKIVTLYSNKQTGLLAAVLLLSAADILFYGSVDAGEIDLFFMLLVTLQAFCIFYFSEKQQWLSMFLLSYLLTAAGLLTKFLPAIVFQALTLLIWLIYSKKWKRLFSWQHIAGIVLCFAVVGIYFYAYAQQGNIQGFLINLINESTQQSGLESNAKAIFLNVLHAPIQLFYIMLPATAFFFYLLNKQVRHSVWKNRLFIFCLLFFLVNIPVYIFTKRTPNRYLYPFFPFVIITACCVFYQASVLQPTIKKLISYKAVLWICISLCLLRIIYNIWIIPYQMNHSSQLVYRKMVENLFVYTGRQPIHLTGKPDTLYANPSLPFISLKSDSLLIPPIVPPQIPYYITLHTNAVMQYDSIPKKDFFYVAPEEFIQNKNVTVYTRFEEVWHHKKLALVKFH